MMRPQGAGWFEVLVARDDATALLEALAATGLVELEPRVRAGPPPGMAEAQPLLARGTELAQRYAAYWPREGLVPSPFPEAPLPTLARGIARIEAWARDAEPLIAQAQRAALEREELDRWSPVLGALLEPQAALLRAEKAGDFTARLALQEEFKLLPLGAVWDYHCLREGAPAGAAWLEAVRRYERDTLPRRS